MNRFLEQWAYIEDLGQMVLIKRYMFQIGPLAQVTKGPKEDTGLSDLAATITRRMEGADKKHKRRLNTLLKAVQKYNGLQNSAFEHLRYAPTTPKVI